MSWRRRAIHVAVLTAVFCLCAMAARPRADAAWHTAGASVYGGRCEALSLGYRGDNLALLPNSFAELGMGRIHGLPYKAKVRFRYHGRTVTGVKRDIGGGGRPVGGYTRTWDFWEPLLTKLLGHRNCYWTGVVQWRRI